MTPRWGPTRSTACDIALRRPTSGWYIWCGEGGPGQADDYFQPLHAGHLRERLPEAVPYLGLGPGWRFIVRPGYEDVWFDDSLLDVDS